MFELPKHQWLFLVPIKGGIGGIVHPPIGSIYHLYTTYILPSRGLYNPYHLLPEPEKSIEGLAKASPNPRNSEGFWKTTWIIPVSFSGTPSKWPFHGL